MSRMVRMLTVCAVLGSAPFSSHATEVAPTSIDDARTRALVPADEMGYLVGPEVQIVATLRTGGHPLAGETLTFTTGARVICSALTDARGEAWCSASEVAAALPMTDYKVSFPGNQRFAPSVASGRLDVVAIERPDGRICWANYPGKGLIGCSL